MSRLRVEGLSIEFGGVRAIDALSFELERGRIHAIIGPNGAGKTTLFNLITGLYRPGAGRILFEDEDVAGRPPHELAARGLSRTFQNLQVFERMTALENVMVGRHLHEDRSLLAHLLRLPRVVRNERATRDRALELLGFVGLGAHADERAGALPYGALKRLEIARALATEPRMLLLDEPAAGCNRVEAGEIDRLVRRVAAEGVTVVLVEHDMHLVMNLAEHVVVLDYGRKLAEGTAAEVRANPEVIAAYLGTRARA
ncbi:MAG TPA: ABC transporter ATP-binding protein [Geminicoccaceae bacterium]|nr:ABC transporter ATP-binding protein [Geminicoccaceae bacterium]